MAQIRLNNAMMADLQRAFSLKDYNNAGKIYAQDIGAVVRSVNGIKPSEVEIQEIVSAVNRSGGEVDLQTLVQYISSECTNPDVEKPEDMAEMFRMFDREGRGYISISELRHLLTSVGEKLTEEEADDIIKYSGCVDRGSVNYMQFVKTVMQ